MKSDMFDIDPDNLVSKTDKLLYNIWQELKQLRPTAEGTEAVIQKPKVIACKKCGEEFDNRGKFLSHSREHKKEGK